MQNSHVLSAVGPAGTVANAGATNEFHNMHMKVNAPYGTKCVVALETSIDGTTWVERDRVTGPGWASGGLNFTEQYARANVVNLGGVPSVSVVLTGHL
jgi:hypothetical protein